MTLSGLPLVVDISDVVVRELVVSSLIVVVGVVTVVLFVVISVVVNSKGDKMWAVLFMKQKLAFF